MQHLLPGSVIGILGGGQLGRMLAMAAAQLGYRSHVFCPDAKFPADQVTGLVTRAAYTDRAALRAFAEAVDVVTYEFENIPVETVEFLGGFVPVFPSARVLQVSQDRLHEKDFVNGLGIATAEYAAVAGLAEAREALAAMGGQGVLKTRRLGYDGKGQAVIRTADALAEGWRALGGDRLGADDVILERFVPFDMEISVIAARGRDGEVRCFPPVENRHRNHILDVSIAPARIDEGLQREAVAIAGRLIEALDYVGVMTVELFVSADSPRLRVNEIAPRVHNSGHWTIEGAATSQFEQHVRALCGLPLGSVALYGQAVMTNLIGEDILRYEELLREPGAHVHHYGKIEARPGRKMGHVTRLYEFSKKLEL